MTVLLCGIPSETPLALVRGALTALGIPHVQFNQRQWRHTTLQLALDEHGVQGTLRADGRHLRLEDVAGIYVRLMDDRLLPDLAGASPAEQATCRRLHDAFAEWIELAPCRVVSRAAAMASNASKPYQSQLIRDAGFDVPDTLVTNDPTMVDAFRARHARVVFKSTSGVRSVVRTFTDADRDRLELIRWCPVQFQEFIDGYNVRVHTVGTTALFATRIVSPATDYRYAAQEDEDDAELTATTLSEPVGAQCLRLAAALDLPFAGIDLKVSPAGRIVCFEVNPCPAFSYYEHHTGQPIARAVALYLAGRDPADA